MPIIGVRKAVLDKKLEKVYTEKEFDSLCFDYGLELDEVTSEKATIQKEQGKTVVNASDEEVYKIELPANRYDLLSVEGLAKALLVFQKKHSIPQYQIVRPPVLQRLVVKPETAQIRPFVVSAILRDVTFDADSYASFIDLQDKLHQNICRKRTLVAIGTHDLDTIQGPFEYRAEPPTKIKFKPLNQTKEYTAVELMELYQTEAHLKPYLPIIQDSPVYPVIYDKNGIVLSMPPIINGEHSKITLKTKNVFIEATATDLTKAKVVLDTIVALFSQYCAKPFTVEPVAVENADGSVVEYPMLKYRTESVEVEMINRKIGINLKAEEMADLLTRMCLQSTVANDGRSLQVTIPPTRHDVIHACDIAEDVAVAYGFNKIVNQLPEGHTVGKAFPINKLSDLLRVDIAAAGWTESLNFALCSRDDISTKLRQEDGIKSAVLISNPKTAEFQVARTTLLAGLLKTLACNRDMPVPLRLFELQDVVLKDEKSDVGARNERRLAAVYSNKSAGFEIIHGFLDRIMQLVDVKCKRDGTGYYIRACEDPTYFPGRCAEVVGPKDVPIGKLGIIHPDVLTAFGLTLPVSAVEINIEPFL
uniref:Phenylalanine--tRNA ligase beta subunit n=1 Tax=Plectus sambesii TaxID=2011161 RepID=A0A914X3S7_9BILA